MSDSTHASPTIPDDDTTRSLAIAGPGQDAGLTHVAVAGGIYTILITGEQTAGRYCLIEMRVPPGGGPPMHRHDFEEMFSVLEGEIELTFRGNKTLAGKGTTVNIPANAPHRFANVSKAEARLLCLCAPAGQEKMFIEVGDPVPSRSSPPPVLNEAEKKARGEKAMALAGKYKTVFVKP